MNIGSVHIDLAALAQVGFALAAIITAWKTGQKAKEKANENKRKSDEGA